MRIMKTMKVLLNVLMILSFSIVTISCRKEVMSGSMVNTTIPTTIGSIVDLGAISGDVHTMSVSLPDVSLTMSDLYNGDTNVKSKLVIDLLSNSDGIISDGAYAFSESTDVTPFTFKKAQVYVPNIATGGTDIVEMNSGTITVTRTGILYTISVDGMLSNGNPIQVSFAGDLTYSDLG
jgi:hypothetical protein